MAVLLKDALKPNLVQTLENNPAIVHGGPFANIAHGCNSVIATQAALKLGEYVVTEAGFGADLGAQKFMDIKCRQSGLRPDCAVVVATIRALKYHGHISLKELTQENIPGLEKGLVNLKRHIDNLQKHYGVPCVVAINHFTSDTPAEIACLEQKSEEWEIPIVTSTHWAHGSEGSENLAKAVVRTVETRASHFRLLYDSSLPLWDKMKRIAQDIYGATDITAEPK
jgi:formate--tetrahydrofolate ligase